MSNTPSSAFAAEFPAVATCSLDLAIKIGGTLDEHPQPRSYEGALPEYIRCINPRCRNGGWSPWPGLRALVARRETTGQIGGVCQGSERLNRTQSRTCLTLFQGKVSVVYK